MPTFFGDGNTPRRSDTQWIILQKILGALTGSGSSGGGGGALGGTQQVYIGRNPLPPDVPSLPAINYAAGGGPMTEWDVATQVWL